MKTYTHTRVRMNIYKTYIKFHLYIVHMCVHMYTHTHIYILFISVRILVSKDICKLLDLNFGTNLELICL